ncbi:MAG: hypothetical protein ACI4D3_14020 [Lachnospiraceae bacterium]
MIYGDTACSGSVYWLTEGVAEIPAWRNTMAMGLAFPGIILYGIALFAIEKFLRREKHHPFPLLVLDGRIRQELSAKENGDIQSFDPLCGTLAGQISPAGWSVPN